MLARIRPIEKVRVLLMMHAQRQRLEMLGIQTASITAEMVNLPVRRDRTHEQLVGGTVGKRWLAPDIDGAITIRHDVAEPVPAASRRVELVAHTSSLIGAEP